MKKYTGEILLEYASVIEGIFGNTVKINSVTEWYEYRELQTYQEIVIYPNDIEAKRENTEKYITKFMEAENEKYKYRLIPKTFHWRNERLYLVVNARFYGK